MNEKVNYISDDELEQLIRQVEQEELIPAPPGLAERIFEAAGLPVQKIMEVNPVAARKKEFFAYCFRVITSVAAAVALVFLLPEMTEWMGQKISLAESNRWSSYRQEAPSMEEVVETVPQKEQIVSAKPAPTKEEVLNDSAFLDKVLEEANWFGRNKKSN